jgi:hypothetical protein
MTDYYTTNDRPVQDEKSEFESVPDEEDYGLDHDGPALWTIES